MRPAGVLCLIDPSSLQLPLLLLRRSSDLRSHPGQVAFPGGRQDPSDGPLWRTALREAEEELHIPSQSVELRGRASIVPTWNSGFAIAPFVALVRGAVDPRASLSEVEDFFWFPLLPDAAPAPARTERVEVPEGEFEVSGYRSGSHFVWGATGAILGDLLRRMAPG